MLYRMQPWKNTGRLEHPLAVETINGVQAESTIGVAVENMDGRCWSPRCFIDNN